MPTFFALVDAVSGRESEVGTALRGISRLDGVHPCKEGNMDFLVSFHADAFNVVDDFLQTYVRRIPGVKGVEIVVDWDDHSSDVRDARDALMKGRPQA